MKSTSPHTQLTKHLTQSLPNYIEILRQMVETNSFTTNRMGVNRLGEITIDHFNRLGLTAETVQAANPLFGKHLVLTRQGTSNKKIGLVSHLDTVYPIQEEIENDFRWRPAGDRIYGPGTIDIKGGTVMIYAVLDALRTIAPKTFEAINWVVLLNAAEEHLALDFGELARNRLREDSLACLVFEGGKFEQNQTFKLVTGRKGMARYAVRTRGRAAHAGNLHHTGANAILEMADVVQKIAKLTDYTRDLTFNVGVFKGGSVVNRVPHRALVEVEMRTHRQDAFEEGVQHMLALTGPGIISSHTGDYTCAVEIDVLRRDAPWPANEASNRLLHIWQTNAATLGLNVAAERRGGLSDGNQVWQVVPTVDGLGPAGGNAHSSEHCEDGSKTQEYVLPASYIPKGTLNALALMTLAEPFV